MGNNPSVSGTRPPTMDEIPRHLVETFGFDLVLLDKFFLINSNDFDILILAKQEVPAHAQYEDQEVPAGGVGLVFVKDTSNQYIVNLLVRNGPAHRSRQIRQGDILVSIDGTDVYAGSKNGSPLVDASIQTLSVFCPTSDGSDYKRRYT